MTDEELVEAFESGRLPADDFTHAAHVRVAWWCLRAEAHFADALARFVRAIRAFAHRHGADAKYHETVTVAWMAVIAERLHETPDLDWNDFAERHPDLFTKPSVLTRYYDDATLASDRARRVFLLPCPERPAVPAGRPGGSGRT